MKSPRKLANPLALAVRPERTTYRLTDAGEAEMNSWLRSLVGIETAQLGGIKQWRQWHADRKATRETP
jgi:DNA-binding PadR family transcriptional regulator